MANLCPEFSGLSHRDNWYFDDSVQEMKKSLASLKGILRDGRGAAMQMLIKKYEAASRVWREYHFALMNRLISMRVSLAPGGGSSQAQLDRQPSYGELERKLGHLAYFAGGEAVRNDFIQEALQE